MEGSTCRTRRFAGNAPADATRQGLYKLLANVRLIRRYDRQDGRIVLLQILLQSLAAFYIDIGLMQKLTSVK